MAGVASDKGAPDLKETTEYKRSHLVVDGKVVKREYLDGDGEKAKVVSKGSHYRLSFQVSRIRKVKGATAEEGVAVTVVGPAVNDKKEEYSLPGEKALVVAFLLMKKGTNTYEPVDPDPKKSFKFDDSPSPGRGKE